MRRTLQLLSWIALAAVIVPPVLFLAGQVTLAQTQSIMLLATILWFATASLWMGRNNASDETTN